MKHFIPFAIAAIMIGASFTTNAQTWWSQTSNSTDNLRTITFNDLFNGVAFGDTLSAFVKTSNQGNTWSASYPSFSEGDLYSSSYLNGSTIVAVGSHDVLGGNGLVIKTTDNGATWTANTSIPEKIFDVSFVNNTQGWISGENGYIARTTDSGVNWLQLNTGTGEDIFSVDFVNENEGWAVGTVDGEAVILHTSNSGTNWSLQSSNITNPLLSVFFIDNLTGWAVGGSGNILATSNGGASWVAQTSGITNDLNDVYFINALKGWAVGTNGSVLKTTDGGANWLAETSGTTQDINSVYMRNDSLGWFCGDNGTIHVYGYGLPNSLTELSSKNQISIYPNPAGESFTISIDGQEGDWTVSIYDIKGELVREQTVVNNSTLTIAKEKLSTGIYNLRISFGQGQMQSRKVVFN